MKPTPPPSRSNSPSSRRLVIGGAAAVILFVVAIALPVVMRHPADSDGAVSTAESFGRAPAYTLTDQRGRRVESRQFDGKVQVVSYLFPYCTTYCPVIARNLVLLDRQLSHDHLDQRVQLVAFNVDPGGAGPAQLRAFWSEFGGDPADPHFSFLTGTPAQIHAVVADGFHVDYERVPGGDASDATSPPTVPNPLAQRAHVNYDVEHNDFLEIVGPQGRIRQIFDNGSQVTPGQLVPAIRAALR